MTLPFDPALRRAVDWLLSPTSRKLARYTVTKVGLFGKRKRWLM